MTSRIITLDGVELLVEVDPDVAVDMGQQPRELTSGGTIPGRDRNIEACSPPEKTLNRANELRQMLEAVIAPVKETLSRTEPAEWSIEVQVGFKGETGIPCLVKGQGSGSIKLSAKWKK